MLQDYGSFVSLGLVSRDSPLQPGRVWTLVWAEIKWNLVIAAIAGLDP